MEKVLIIWIGGDLLSHVLRRSTIGAVVLNCRVRDGTGCFTHAMTTKPNNQKHGNTWLFFVGFVDFAVQDRRIHAGLPECFQN